MKPGLILLITVSILIIFNNACEKEEKDLEKPEVLILNPAQLSKIRIDSTFKVNVDAMDNVGISLVVLLIDGEMAGRVFKPPYTFEIKMGSLQSGLHTLMAKAYDISDNIGISEVVNIEIVEKPQNILKGIVTNSLNEPIEGAVISVSKKGFKSSFLTTPSSYDISSQVNKKLLFDNADNNNSFNYDYVTISKKSSQTIDEVITDIDGYYEFIGLTTDDYVLTCEASGYYFKEIEVVQSEGISEYDLKLEMLDDLQINDILVTDLEYKIKVEWEPLDIPSIEGYNIYERHFFYYSLEGREDSKPLYPVFSVWSKVNLSPINGSTYEFDAEEYNGKYGICVVPVNKEGTESKITDNTIKRYLDLKDKKRGIILFRGLFYFPNPIYIPDSSHEVALHMRFYYGFIPSSTIDKWDVYISEDSFNWGKIGGMGLGSGQSGGIMAKEDYGYYQSFSLNDYKGKNVIIKTEPQFGNTTGFELETYIQEYSQDGTDFEPLQDIGNTTTGNISFNSNLNYGSVDDIDGNIYRTIQIGEQEWMAQNLATTRFNDGTYVPLVTDPAIWSNLSTPGYCYYENDAAKYAETYGALYNWHAVNTKKLCPAGWHVPTDSEWTTLITNLGGENEAGGKLKEQGILHWDSPNIGTNETGFTALPDGHRGSDYGDFFYVGKVGDFWSATESSSFNAWFRRMAYLDSGVLRWETDKKCGFSVRCLKD